MPIRVRIFQCSFANFQFILPSLNLSIKKKLITAKKYLSTAIMSGGTISDTIHRPNGQVPPQMIIVKINSKYAIISCLFFMLEFELNLISLDSLKNVKYYYKICNKKKSFYFPIR
jgi:hypothetical protein